MHLKKNFVQVCYVLSFTDETTAGCACGVCAGTERRATSYAIQFVIMPVMLSYPRHVILSNIKDYNYD